jgi:hypothetical protein
MTSNGTEERVGIEREGKKSRKEKRRRRRRKEEREGKGGRTKDTFSLSPMPYHLIYLSLSLSYIFLSVLSSSYSNVLHERVDLSRSETRVLFQEAGNDLIQNPFVFHSQIGVLDQLEKEEAKRVKVN